MKFYVIVDNLIRMMIIRRESKGEFDHVNTINLQAFETDAEAKLVNRLKELHIPIIFLIAEKKEILTGHFLFIPMTINSHEIKIADLETMAVLSKFQNSGIGFKLVEKGLEFCKEEDYAAVVLLDHSNYNPKIWICTFNKIRFNFDL